ncbi:HAMP domain-containing sensor histidine kinase [Endozoicomonas sp. 8E]|uniref:sensor histidine kinase n=1 Tax=Endozoicomonas sp. 8E TaxID=3035692 RepID=UPI002939543C|nr:HAMP domain-containing sensor histidine kinase [Endozoicomonas sp. 8E]WOG29207.1 HAMP domain-containing sensor histidine kinase [Endozoicomonas sp. 8E]
MTPTKRILTFWFGFIMLMIASGLGAVSYHLFEEELVSRDAQLLKVINNNMQRIYNSNGQKKILSVLERDRYFLRLSGYSASLWANDGELLFHEGVDLPFSLTETLSDGSLVTRQLIGNQTLVLSLSGKLRYEELASFRNVMLVTLLALWVISILLVAWLNERMLRPIRKLVEHVKTLQRKGLQDKLPLSSSRNSELGQLTLLFNQQMSRIDQLIRSLEDTLNAAAHDLRTPLTRMRLSAEKAMINNDPRVLKESLMDCLEESERMLAMVNSLLDVAAVEQHLDARDRNRANLSDLITEAAQPYEYLAEEKRIRLSFELPEAMNVLASPNRLRQVFANLLDNALKFTPEEGSILVSARQEGDEWRVSVKDSGSGIAASDLPHIFDRLYRGDTSRKTPGFGLGLSLVKAIIEAHDGRIKVESKKGQGTEFNCLLPAA